ncbi:MAG TPA: hypothetical protein VK614_10600 [Allosphingosinicella sp.]|nr:hypothetical protein [Allosphingosinicella sp.]
MKFFIPAAADAAMAEDALDGIRCFLLEQGYPTTARRIRRIAFWNRGDHFDLEVGGEHPGMKDEWPLGGRREELGLRCLVVAILEKPDGDWFYVCLPYRGVFRNYPWLVHRDEVTAMEDFEAQSPPSLSAPARRGRRA